MRGRAGQSWLYLRIEDRRQGICPARYDEMELSEKTLLKIDVQGYEDRVLRGATRTLERVHYVIVEVSVGPLYDGQAQFHTIYEFLVQSGFSYMGNMEQLSSPMDGSILQVDSLFGRTKS